MCYSVNIMRTPDFFKGVAEIIPEGDSSNSDALGAAIVLELPTLPPDIAGKKLQPLFRAITFECKVILKKPGSFSKRDARRVERLRPHARKLLEDYFNQWKQLSQKGGSDE